MAQPMLRVWLYLSTVVCLVAAALAVAFYYYAFNNPVGRKFVISQFLSDQAHRVYWSRHSAIAAAVAIIFGTLVLRQSQGPLQKAATGGVAAGVLC